MRFVSHNVINIEDSTFGCSEKDVVLKMQEGDLGWEIDLGKEFTLFIIKDEHLVVRSVGKVLLVDNDNLRVKPIWTKWNAGNRGVHKAKKFVFVLNNISKNTQIEVNNMLCKTVVLKFWKRKK